MNIDFLQPFVLLKIGVLMLLFLYAIFALVVFVQVQTMNRVIKQPPVDNIASGIAVVHIALVIGLFLWALVIL